jgi:hypothetical protein
VGARATGPPGVAGAELAGTGDAIDGRVGATVGTGVGTGVGLGVGFGVGLGVGVGPGGGVEGSVTVTDDGLTAVRSAVWPALVAAKLYA